MTDMLFTDIPARTIATGTDLIHTAGHATTGLGAGAYVSDALATAALLAAHPLLVAQSANGRIFRALPAVGRIPVEQAGAQGNGLDDDRPEIAAAIAYSHAIGARGVSFAMPGYYLNPIPEAELPPGTAVSPRVLIPEGCAPMDWGGARFEVYYGNRGFVFAGGLSGTVTNFPLAANVTAGDRSVTLEPGAAIDLAVGDTVMWQLGELPYDTPETLNWDFAVVTAIDSDVVSLDKPIPEGLALGSVTGVNKRLRKLPILRDFLLRDMRITGPEIETGIHIYGGQRITVERVGAERLRGSLFSGQYCDGVTLRDCWLDGSVIVQASHGAAFGFVECRNVLLERPRAKGVQTLVRAEAGAEVCAIGPCLENTITNASGASLGNQVIAFHSVGRSKLSVHNATVTGFGGYKLAETNNGQAGYGGTVSFTGITRLVHPTSPYSIPLEQISGTLDMTIGGVNEVYNMERLRSWKRRFVLRDGESLSVFGPTGLLVRGRAYTSPGVTVGAGQQLRGFYIGRQGDNGFNVAQGSSGQLVPGQDVFIKVQGGTVLGSQWNLRANPLKLLCVTAANAGLDATNSFVEFEGWIAEQRDTAFTMTEADWRGIDAERDPHEALFQAHDLPAIGAGEDLAVDLSIPDMAASDFIESVRMSGGFGELQLLSATAMAGQARLLLTNPTANPVDRAAADLAVAFFKPMVGQ